MALSSPAGDQFQVDKAIEDDGYVERQREILERNGLDVAAIRPVRAVGETRTKHRSSITLSSHSDVNPDEGSPRAAEGSAP